MTKVSSLTLVPGSFYSNLWYSALQRSTLNHSCDADKQVHSGDAGDLHFCQWNVFLGFAEDLQEEAKLDS